MYIFSYVNCLEARTPSARYSFQPKLDSLNMFVSNCHDRRSRGCVFQEILSVSRVYPRNSRADSDNCFHCFQSQQLGRRKENYRSERTLYEPIADVGQSSPNCKQDHGYYRARLRCRESCLSCLRNISFPSGLVQLLNSILNDNVELSFNLPLNIKYTISIDAINVKS